ncbi:MAG: twin-arginine translocase TatA/TatE family subunit [Actinomycetaceae bacterium]|nr:twin-arginine translocase TatA/TatE family subunit [Actinomycetaceae bacterium]
MRPSHIIVLIVILIIVFGASKLPEIARNIGKSAKVLKSELQDLSEDTPKAIETEETKNPEAK